jgi:acetyl-CoA acetyltransferase family protein
MKKVVIVDYLRSPFSRSRPQQPERDKFNPLRMDHVAALLVEKIVKRTGVNPSEINEVLPASAFGVWEQWTYGGRAITMLAKLPVNVPAVFVDRQCGSSMSAVHFGAMEIMTGYSDLVIACGMEHMTHIPMADPRWISPPMALVEKEEYQMYEMETGFVMGLTAEKLFAEGKKKHGLTREDMDKWSLRSHQLAAKGQQEGFFDGEIMPIEVTYPDGTKETIDKDLSVRPTTTLEKIQSLPPAFKPDGGVITAGNSSPLNAGASCMMLASEEKAESLGLASLGTIKSMGWAGVHPSVMGKGPVPASRMALKHAGLNVGDIDFWEINEAFAIVTLWDMKELGINPEKANVKGGAIAIGHPLGATGARLVGTVSRILEAESGTYGLATACVGGGQGVATVIERE